VLSLALSPSSQPVRASPPIAPGNMSAVDAMAVLGLHPGFSAEQLQKQYYRMALRHHPDKAGGSVAMMQKVTAARDVLARIVQHPEPSVDIHRSATPPPSVLEIAQVTQWAKEFLARLRAVPKQHRHRGCAMGLYTRIHDIAMNPLMAAMVALGDSCVQLMVRHLHVRMQASEPLDWTSCGFKYLSYQGYDIDGLRVIDYGNREYLAVMEFWSLSSPDMLKHLGSLQEVWPTYLDLWRMDKTSAHIERLADVVEIIIGAVREEPWFRCVTAHYRPLPAFFNLLVALCRLVQHLDARLHSGYLKHKREVLPKFTSMDESEFCQCWSNSRYPQGLLLFGLIQACVQNA